MATGWNTPGTAAEARTARPVLPEPNKIGSPVLRSAATTAIRRGRASSGLFATALLMKFCRISPSIHPRLGQAQPTTCFSVMSSAVCCRSKPLRPEA